MNHSNIQDDLVDYYRREIAYLRESGDQFSQRYPKVAQRLAFNASESKDPHTERIIESFAFLTARVQREIDREFPTAALAILENICPSLTRPTPSMGIAHMTLDANQGKVMAGIKVPRATFLQALASSGHTCRFQTTWDAELWPLNIESTSIEDSRGLVLKFVTHAGVDLRDLDLDCLRLHLSGEFMISMPLYDVLVSNLERIEIGDEKGNRLTDLSPKHLVEVGYSEGEQVLPQSGSINPAFNLLQEYFAFPQKFLFFDLKGLKGRLGQGSGFKLKFIFKSASKVLSSVSKNTFKLGCVPIINLFPKTSEPITFERRQHEYLLVPDYHRETSHEIHSVESVISSDPEAKEPQILPYLFSTDRLMEEENHIFWNSRREQSLRPGISGTDVFISFVDRSHLNQTPGKPVLYAKLMCTNRRVAEMVQAGSRFIGESISSNIVVHNLYEPVAQKNPLSASKSIYSLVEVLRLNHHSLIYGDEPDQHLKVLLFLFAGEASKNQVQVRGIKSLKAKPSIARIGRDTWRGHCVGNDIWLDLDESAFVGGSGYIFAGVLARFFGLYTTVNSYTRLGLMRNGEVLRQWPAFAGWQCLI
jgi:type VI secretion system protein ImpG